MPPGMEAEVSMINLDVPPGRTPAKSYSFELDPFQKAAVACIEREESVLVSAHTSAGKTVCAEYAIATSLRDSQRVLYTSPIKALSNQKYRELKADFGDVGLMTGDHTIDVDASCLVMTTEILRSMLYRGSEVMREVKWVIFDEVHYMRDKERGVVWEEVMILLPHSVRYVFLSATIPNALEFASWIAQLHTQPCHVVYTGYRPTPLMHYVFPAGGSGIYNVVDEKARFKSDNFTKAISAIKSKVHVQGGLEDGGGGGRGRGGRDGSTLSGGGKGGGRGGKGGKGGKGGGEASDCFKLVQLIVGKGCEPLIVFAFGKNKCEKLAKEMDGLVLNTKEESAMVEQIYQNAVATLSEDDQALPQVSYLLPMVTRGVAVHHSGLLPLLKELIEILFSENLVKLLFATETFAMGLNMPARTVLFAELSKFDGKDFRYLTSGEYIQMSGRAGRRGLDSRGLVVQMIDDRTDTAKVREMLTGAADVLSSKFHLGYNMLLNCVRVETVDVEMLIQKSFYTYQQQLSLPMLRAEQRSLMDALSAPEIQLDRLEAVTELHATLFSELALRDEIRAIVNEPIHSVPYLQPGRLVQVRAAAPSSDDHLAGSPPMPDWGWGVIVNFKRKVAKAEAAAAFVEDADKKNRGSKADSSGGAGAGEAVSSKPGGERREYSVDVLLRCAPGADPIAAGGDVPPPSSHVGNGAAARRTAHALAEAAAAAAAKEGGKEGGKGGGKASLDAVAGGGAEEALAAVEEEEGCHVVTVPLSYLDQISSVRIKMPPDLRPPDARHGILKVLKEVAKRFPMGVPVLDAQKDMKVAHADLGKLQRRLETCQARLQEERLQDPELHVALPTFRQRLDLATKERRVRSRMREVEAVLMQDELKGMRRVLRRLGHLSEDGVIQNKGRVACELSTADELLCTELVFSGLLNELDPGPLAALLSCLVTEGGSKGGGSGGGGGKGVKVHSNLCAVK